MSKSYRANSDDNKKNYRQMDYKHRSMVAMGMIVSGSGRKQIFKDKRTKRQSESKDWMAEEDR